MDDRSIVIQRVQLAFRLEPHWAVRKLFLKHYDLYDVFSDKRHKRSHFITGDQIKVTIVKKQHL